MSALGNDTSYRRAEGESTQWEDIQRRLGNFPAVKKPEVCSLHGHSQHCEMLWIFNFTNVQLWTFEDKSWISLPMLATPIDSPRHCVGQNQCDCNPRNCDVLQKAKAFQPAPDRDKVTDLIEAEDSADLDELEDDFKDDVFLEQYRWCCWNSRHTLVSHDSSDHNIVRVPQQSLNSRAMWMRAVI